MKRLPVMIITFCLICAVLLGAGKDAVKLAADSLVDAASPVRYNVTYFDSAVGASISTDTRVSFRGDIAVLANGAKVPTRFSKIVCLDEAQRSVNAKRAAYAAFGIEVIAAMMLAFFCALGVRMYNLNAKRAMREKARRARRRGNVSTFPVRRTVSIHERVCA